MTSSNGSMKLGASGQLRSAGSEAHLMPGLRWFFALQVLGAVRFGGGEAGVADLVVGDGRSVWERLPLLLLPRRRQSRPPQGETDLHPVGELSEHASLTLSFFATETDQREQSIEVLARNQIIRTI